MYNNYYQHCDVYGIGATSGSNIFMESNVKVIGVE